MAQINTFGVASGWSVLDTTTGSSVGAVLSWVGNVLTLQGSGSLTNAAGGSDTLVFTAPVISGNSFIVPMIEFFPVLGLGESVSYVYAQRGWITNSMGVQYPNVAWQADTDLSLLSERLIRFGAVYRWKMSKGFDYAEAMADYEGALNRIGGQEDTAPPIGMSEYIGTYDTWPGIITDNTDTTF